ncbi:MAG TPA: DUF1579 domain-containing protein [Thermoanaerobaculia bacterium]|nr:DUF1579 domain-containing protein [Thermoanaerobaculia bacterium]
MLSRRKLAVFSLSIALLSGGAAVAQDNKQPEGNSMGMSHEQMEAMMKAMAPGEMHKALAKMAGDWTFTNKFWMAPDQPAQESSGTMHAETILGGRYVQSVWKGDMMGQPFEGHGTDGYDNVSKQFVSSWVDNMGTGIMISTGSCEDGGKKCTSTGSFSDPMTGGQSTMRSVVTWIDDNTFKNEMFGKDPSGKEFKTMEIVAKRK